MRNIYDEFDMMYLPEPNTGCWLWTGKMDSKNQYGIFELANIPFGTHRISYELFNGEISLGKLVCHSCDVMSCVNPEHLWLGTKKDNAVDAVQKGIMKKGELSNGAKLTKQNAIDILSKKGIISQVKLSKMYNVSPSCIQSIMDRRAWKEIDQSNNLNHMWKQPKTIPDVKFLDRFENSFTSNCNEKCWEWNEELSKSGYGIIRIGKTVILAHRLSFEIFNGELKDLFVCHSCDNRKCINPNHLWLGSQKENILDAVAKGRMNQGENGFHSKLNELTVRNIINLWNNGTTTSELSNMYNLSQSYLSILIGGKSWKHLSIENRPKTTRTKNKSRKLTQKQIEKIVSLRPYKTIAELSELFNVSKSHIFRIVSDNWTGK